MNSNWFKLAMKITKVEYGKNLLLKGVPIIFNKGGAKLKIGENVTIKSSFLSNLVGLYSRTIIVTRAPGAEIEIGDNVGISGATIYARKKITIGENTCIGGNCKILDNDFHPIEAETRNKLLRDENGGDSDLVPSREIKIGKNCFIGCNSIILKGTVLNEATAAGKSTDPENPNPEIVPGNTEDPTDHPNGHLTVTKETTSTPANGEAYALGETITYKITAANDGNLTLKNVVVTDELTGDEWTIDSLAPGQSSEAFTASHKVTQKDILNGSVVNEATAAGKSPDPDKPDP